MGPKSTVEIITRVAAREMRQSAAAKLLSLSLRQIQRLVARYCGIGAEALVSKRRGRPSNRRLSEYLRQDAVNIIRERYSDFGPTLACEKLSEIHGIRVSVETVRTWMIEEGLWVPKKARERRVHQPRRRRPCRGELVQIDGSPHDWFEGRGPKCTLLIFIDDATGELGELRFVRSESTFDYFEATKRYLERHGRPVAFYSDKHSIFRKANKDDKEFSGDTQFGRVLRELNIDILCAHSPQAKGRVERANLTLQDRMVKELRLAGIDTIEDANAFVPFYLDDFNARFGRVPASDVDAHRPLRDQDDLERRFCWRESRKLTKNLVLHYKRVTYLVVPDAETKRCANHKVEVHEWADGSVELWHDGKSLPYTTYDKAPRVKQGALVENKRLGAALAMCQELQQKNEQELLDSRKLTLREKDRRQLQDQEVG